MTALFLIINIVGLLVIIGLIILKFTTPVAKEYQETIPDDPYKMCTPQDAQIDCRIDSCKFQKEGYCLRQGGPAITLRNTITTCWTHKPRQTFGGEYSDQIRGKDLNQGDGRPIESLKSAFEKIAFSDRKAADESWKDNLSASALMEVEKGEKDLQKHLEKIDLMCRKEETLNEVILKGKKPTHKDKQSDHNSYGLRNWLSQKGFCAGDNNSFDNAEYQGLVTAFCESNGFDHSKSVGFKSMETFCQNRFGLFKKFSFAYFSKKP